MRLVAIPGDGDGYPCEAPALLDREFPARQLRNRLRRASGGCGRSRSSSKSTAQRRSQPQIVCLWGPGGSGKTTALLELARIARRNGFVPISVRLIGSPLGAVMCRAEPSSSSTTRRHGLAPRVARSGDGFAAGARRRVHARAKMCRGIAGAGLGRLSAAALAAAVRPAHLAFGSPRPPRGRAR